MAVLIDWWLGLVDRAQQLLIGEGLGRVFARVKRKRIVGGRAVAKRGGWLGLSECRLARR